MQRNPTIALEKEAWPRALVVSVLALPLSLKSAYLPPDNTHSMVLWFPSKMRTMCHLMELTIARKQMGPRWVVSVIEHPKHSYRILFCFLCFFSCLQFSQDLLILSSPNFQMESEILQAEFPQYMLTFFST